MIPGEYWNTNKDRPLIIGAHWDTYGLTGGFNDNGSGVAALLEAARVLSAARCFSPNYSVIFVVFDAEEVGCAGSENLIATYIKPLLHRQGIEVQGAIILDTIFNYDQESKSQKFTKVCTTMHGLSTIER